LPSTSGKTAQPSGSATTAAGAAAPVISQQHAKRLRERGLNPILCERLGVHSVDGKTLGFHYFVGRQIHNTKLRRGKGNMPWVHGGKELVLWNLDCLADDPAPDEEVIITEGEFDAIAVLQCGFTRVVSVPNGAQTGEHGFKYLFRGKELIPDLAKFQGFVLALDSDRKGLASRNDLAVRLGDERCRWVAYPDGCKDANDVLKTHGPERLRQAIADAKPMWTDEVARMGDIPDPPANEPRYRIGLAALDHHGLRITLPAFWPIIGPYSSGKSVLVRQLLVNFWRLHGWRPLLTAFEENVKPRYQRDFRRHLIERAMLPDQPWTTEEIAAADAQLNENFVFLRRAPDVPVTADWLLDRVEYAVRVYGVKVVAIDPVNELRLTPAFGMSKTDFMGDFIMSLKALGEKYGLVIICCAHTSKDSTEKKMNRKALLTLNDGEDTRHWGGKADIGWIMWRNTTGPSLLHIDKVKDHETMGRPTLCELVLDRAMNKFSVGRIGYDILDQQKKE
jgi:twinkle protein